MNTIPTHIQSRTTKPILVALATLPLVLASVGCGGDDHGAHAGSDPAADHAGPGPGAASETEIHAPGDGTVQVAGDLARRLGVALSEARVEDLHGEIRATGEIVPDETRLSTVSLRFGGWAERLHVDFTGRFVRAGEPLMEVYSPELVSAQEDLLAAIRLAGHLAGSRVPESAERSEGIVAAARDRLRFWQIPEAEIRRLEETGRVEARTTLMAPFTGYVLEMGVQAGERFEAGQSLYRLADLTRVWLEVEVYERDLPFVQVGTEARITAVGHPEGELAGRITYLYPEVDRERRTARARMELPNPDGHLRPGMYATAQARVLLARGALTVPRDAVLHTGRRAVVFVALGEDRYEAREVEVGAETEDRTQILSGLEPGDRVVSRAGFVLDSESRLMEAMMGQPGMPGMDMEMPMEMPGMDMEMPMEMPMDTLMDMEPRGGPDA